jgi:hypothetical protein
MRFNRNMSLWYLLLYLVKWSVYGSCLTMFSVAMARSLDMIVSYSLVIFTHGILIRFFLVTSEDIVGCVFMLYVSMCSLFNLSLAFL